MKNCIQFNVQGVSFILTSLLITLISVALLIPARAYADDPPPSPHQFYGIVSSNGTTVGPGIQVTAKIAGATVATATTDSQGRYGYSPLMLVTCGQGQPVEFYVESIKTNASVVCTAGANSKLDLAISTAVTQSTATNYIQTVLLNNSDNLTLTGGTLSATKEVASLDGRVRLRFTANTIFNLQGQTTLGAVTESNPQSAADNSTLIRAYSFTPSGATFNPAATMTLKYEPTSLPAGASESNLYIAWYTGSTWEKLTSTVNAATKEVSAPVSHFTIFAIRCTPSTTATTTTTTTTTTTPTVTATPTTIATSILGSNSTLSLSGGVVTGPVSLSGGQVSLSFTAGTAANLLGSQQIGAIRLTSPPTPPVGTKLIKAYSFSPENATFTPSLTFTVQYDVAEIPAGVQENEIYMASLQGSSWASLPSTVNTQNKTITAQIDKFSTFALLGDEPPGAAQTPSISLSELAVTPSEVKAGEPVTVSLRAANSGTGEGSKTVILKVNDRLEAQKAVTLAPGASQAVSFTLTRSDPGTYRVAVEALQVSFEVKPVGKDKDQVANIPVLVVIGVGCLLVLIMVIARVMRQTSD